MMDEIAALEQQIAEREALAARRARVIEALPERRARYNDLRARAIQAQDAGILSGLVKRFRGGTRDDPRAIQAERDDALREVLDLERESIELETKLAATEGLEARLDAAIEARAAEIIASHGPNAPRLAEVATELAHRRAAARHLAVVADIARDASSALDDAIRELAEARDLGRWNPHPDDAVDAARRQNAIERSRAAAGKARGRLTLLNETLSEAGTDVAMADWMASVRRAMDDTPARWWEIAGRVDQDLRSLQRAREQVGRLQASLRGELAGQRDRAQALERERRKLLRTATAI